MVALAIAFPFYLWFFGWNYPGSTAFYLSLVGVLRFFVKSAKSFEAIDWIVAITPIGIGVVVLLNGSQAGLYYPIVVNAGFFTVFYSSLSGPKNLIQRIAEKAEGKALDSTGITYTANVTRVWCCFFVFNIFVSLLFAWTDSLDLWTLYNGIISYFLIAVLFLGERLIRPRFRNTVPAD